MLTSVPIQDILFTVFQVNRAHSTCQVRCSRALPVHIPGLSPVSSRLRPLVQGHPQQLHFKGILSRSVRGRSSPSSGSQSPQCCPLHTRSPLLQSRLFPLPRYVSFAAPSALLTPPPAKLRQLWIIPIFFTLLTIISAFIAHSIARAFRLKRSQVHVFFIHVRQLSNPHAEISPQPHPCL